MATLENKKANSTVILVDDSSIDNFVDSKIISLYQFADNIVVFTKARKALKYLVEINQSSTEEIPFVLFLDLVMPDMDGFEFLNAFNLLPEKIKKHMKIVVLTSSSNPADIEICKKNDSVIAYLNKPLIKRNLEDLEQLLSEKVETC